MIPPINDTDIDWAEQVVGQNITFDQEAREFIRCLGPVEVVACPGSGKTTALIAKLMILSRHLPLPGNRGICVLTHTNVAADEIMRRLSSIGSCILSYPSFCGTFQSFVGHFLGHPDYVQEFGHRPSYVDSEVASRELQRRHSTAMENARFSLKKRGMTIEGLRFNKHFQVVKMGKDVPFIGENTQTYLTVCKVKIDVLKAGYMFYEDAYVLAERYLDRYQGLPELFRYRFPFVFVDEMQDTDERQLRILKTLFGQGTTTQFVGDPNQAIYWRSEVGAECTWQPPADALSLPKSLRFDKPIADVVTRLASVVHVNIEGNGKGSQFKPHLLVFSDARITEVIPAFAQVVVQLGLHRLPIRQVYKAVGWVVKEHDKGKHTVPSYWAGFNAERKLKRIQYATLRGNLSMSAICSDADFPRRFHHMIISSIARFVRAGSIVSPSGRHFTETTIYKHLRETNSSVLRELDSRITDWCLEARTGQDVSADVSVFLVDSVAPHLGVDVSLPNVKHFLTEDDSEELAEYGGTGNLFPFEGGTIEISSVHGVKSETHTATLYLETFYNGYDVHRILPYLKEAIPNGREKKRVKESLKVAFVGCSRPSHLLCVAIHADTLGFKNTRNQVTDKDMEELQQTWDIVDLR